MSRFPLGVILSTFLGALVAVCGAQGGASQKWPHVTQDQRNYTGNIQATDSAYVTGNINSGVYPSLEYPQSPPETHVVYVRGSTVTCSARWKNDNSFALSGTLTWQAAKLAVPDPFGGTDYIDLTVNSAPQSVSLAANGGTESHTLTLTGVPNYVAVGQILVKYSLPLSDGETEHNNGTDGTFYGWERLALVDATPTGLQAVPWADFLEFTCRWAWGANGASQVREYMVKGMHLGSRCDHSLIYIYSDDPQFYTRYWGGDDVRTGSDNTTIHLSEFLGALNEADVSQQCMDFAAILLLALQANGRSATFDIVERWLNSSVPGGFYTWPLCPAGTDRTDSDNYSSVLFSFHAVVACDDYRLDSSSSYLKDTSGSTWKDPVWNWGIEPHWQNHVSSSYFGLAYSTGTAATSPYSSSQEIGHHIRDLQPTGVN